MRWHDERIRVAAGHLFGTVAYTRVFNRIVKPMRDDYEAAILVHQAQAAKLAKRVAELEAQLNSALATIEEIEEAVWCNQCNLPVEHCRGNHGQLYSEGCAP